MSPFDDYQNIQIAIELDKGKNITEIAKKTGISENYIRNLAIRTGSAVSKSKKKRRDPLTEEDRDEIIELVLDGEDPEEIALDFNVSVQYIRKLFQKKKIELPRSYHQLTEQEREEIQELLKDNDPSEIIHAYNVTYKIIELILEKPYKKLNAEQLGVLFELLREDPAISIQSAQSYLNKLGYSIDSAAILSFKERLKSLDMI